MSRNILLLNVAKQTTTLFEFWMMFLRSISLCLMKHYNGGLLRIEASLSLYMKIPVLPASEMWLEFGIDE